MPVDGFAIPQDSIPLRLAYAQQRDPFMHDSDTDSRDTKADRVNGCIDPVYPQAWTYVYGTSHLVNCLAGKPISN